MAEGWMWSSTADPVDAIAAGAVVYMQRHCHFAQWVRASSETLGEAVTLEGIRIIVDSTIPPKHYLFGVNGTRDGAAVAPVTPCNSCNMGSESESGTR